MKFLCVGNSILTEKGFDDDQLSERSVFLFFSGYLQNS